jgi:Spy/CpxP family protein refolding chaperone
MSRRKVWLVIGAVVLLAGATATGLVGIHAARAAATQATGTDLLPPELGARPVGKLFRENLGRLRALRGELGVTPEQREQIKTVLQSHKEEIVTVAREVREQHKQVRRAEKSEPLNEAAIRQAATNMAQSLGDAAVLHAKIRREVMAKLTPEQVKKIETFRRGVDGSVDKALAQAGN